MYFTLLNVACREQTPYPFPCATPPPLVVYLLNIVDIFTFHEVNLTVVLRLIRGCNEHGKTFRGGRRQERWKRRGRDYKGVVACDGGSWRGGGSWRVGGSGIGCRWWWTSYTRIDYYGVFQVYLKMLTKLSTGHGGSSWRGGSSGIGC